MGTTQIAFFVLALTVSQGFCALAGHPPPHELGAAIQLLLPSRLPDLETTVPAYGPRFGFVLGKGLLQTQVLYGYSDSVSAFVGEINYRYSVSTPFFVLFVLAGPHYFHYTFGKTNHDKVGPQLGYGFAFTASKNFDMQLEMKVYFHHKPILSFGGGFVFLI